MSTILIDADAPPTPPEPPEGYRIGYDFTTQQFVVTHNRIELARTTSQATLQLLQEIGAHEPR